MSKIAFISGHLFGKRVLEGLLNSDEFIQRELSIDVVLCLHPRNAINIVGFTDLCSFCIERGLNFFSFNSVKSSQVFDMLSSTKHDFLLVVGLSQLIPANLIMLPAFHNNSQHSYSESHAAIGMHPTMLPEGRGRAPIPWTILKDIRRSGVSTFILNNSADAGPIILQETLKVDENENAGTLFQKVAQTHYNLAKQLSPMLARKKLKWIFQDETKATEWGKRTPADSWIDFYQNPIEIIRLVNALSFPYPEAYFVYKDTLVHVVQAIYSPSYQSDSIPGTIVDTDHNGYPFIKCSKGALLLITKEKILKYQIGDQIFCDGTRVLDNV